MKITVNERFRVTASGSVDLPLPALSVWGQMRDIARFLEMDPLHTRIRIRRPPEGNSPRGATLVIPHRFLGLGPDRIGRILQWNEGRGFAISDLSQRGRDVGFPHICMYGVTSLGPQRSRLTVDVRGRWTATWMPRWLVKLWIWWVLRATEARIRREFSHLCAWRNRRRRSISGNPRQW